MDFQYFGRPHGEPSKTTADAAPAAVGAPLVVVVVLVVLPLLEERRRGQRVNARQQR